MSFGRQADRGAKGRLWTHPVSGNESRRMGKATPERTAQRRAVCLSLSLCEECEIADSQRKTKIPRGKFQPEIAICIRFTRLQ